MQQELTAGSAARWGPLWGSRAADWAASEWQQTPTYEAAIERVGLEAAQRVLDVGCGSGAFLRLVVDHGAEACGLDASEELLEIARRRVPEADLRVGEMEALPFDDGAFDLVTGFNSFFFAADIVAALREAGRVARQGAPVVIQVWGDPERCDLESMKEVARPYLPPPPPGSPSQPPLWRPGALEAIAKEARLTPEESFDLCWSFEYPDEDALGRAMVAPAGIATLVGTDREEAVRADIVEALAPHRAADGSYRLSNEFRLLVARA